MADKNVKLKSGVGDVLYPMAAGLYGYDDRDVKPAEVDTRSVKLFFMQNSNISGMPYSNVNGGFNYSDFLVLKSYGDSSGGIVNGILAPKATAQKGNLGLGLFHTQGAFAGAAWDVPRRLSYSDEGGLMQVVEGAFTPASTSSYYKIIQGVVNKSFACRVRVFVRATSTTAVDWEQILDLDFSGVKNMTSHPTQTFRSAGNPCRVNAVGTIYQNSSTSTNVPSINLRFAAAVSHTIRIEVYNAYNMTLLQPSAWVTCGNIFTWGVYNTYGRGTTTTDITNGYAPSASYAEYNIGMYNSVPAAVTAGDIIYRTSANQWGNATVSGSVIPLPAVIAFSHQTASAGGSTYGNCGGLRQYANTKYYGKVVIGRPIYIRGSLSTAGAFVSDGTITAVMSPGYSYIKTGMCIALSSTSVTVQLSISGTCYTLDDSGVITHIDGVPTMDIITNSNNQIIAINGLQLYGAPALVWQSFTLGGLLEVDGGGTKTYNLMPNGKDYQSGSYIICSVIRAGQAYGCPVSGVSGAKWVILYGTASKSMVYTGRTGAQCYECTSWYEDDTGSPATATIKKIS